MFYLSLFAEMKSRTSEFHSIGISPTKGGLEIELSLRWIGHLNFPNYS